MGRKPKYHTYEELLEAKRAKANEYYELHKDEINKKARDRYQKLKNDSLNYHNP